MKELTNTQKREWARLIYTLEGLNQKETAAKVDVSPHTVGKWAEEGKWDRLKASLLVTKEMQLNRFYAQINELNTAVENKKEGGRYADSKEADTFVKLTAAVKNLESDSSIAEIIQVLRDFFNFLKLADFAMAQKFLPFSDEFIKTKLKSK